MWSLNPNVMIFSKDFCTDQIQKSLRTDRYIKKEGEDEKRNQPLGSCSPIQVGANPHLEKWRKVSDETVKRDWHRKPERSKQLRRFKENEGNADNERKQNYDWHEIDV